MAICRAIDLTYGYFPVFAMRASDSGGTEKRESRFGDRKSNTLQKGGGLRNYVQSSRHEAERREGSGPRGRTPGVREPEC